MRSRDAQCNTEESPSEPVLARMQNLLFIVANLSGKIMCKLVAKMAGGFTYIFYAKKKYIYIYILKRRKNGEGYHSTIYILFFFILHFFYINCKHFTYRNLFPGVLFRCHVVLGPGYLNFGRRGLLAGVVDWGLLDGM